MITVPINVTHTAHNSTNLSSIVHNAIVTANSHTAGLNTTAKLNNALANLTAAQHHIAALTQSVGMYKSWFFTLLVGSALMLVVMFFLYWNTIGKIKKASKKEYGWVHFFLKSGKLKTYLIKLSDRFTIPGLGTYFSDASADVIEYTTGIRHRFFFEGSPFQIKFIPTGVNFTVPESVNPSLKSLFISKAPKVIMLKTDLTSELFDRYLRLSARYGNEIRNVTGKFKITKEMVMGFLFVILMVYVGLKLIGIV